MRARTNRWGRSRRVRAAVAALAFATTVGTVAPLDAPTLAAPVGYVSLDAPMRLLDTRPDGATADGIEQDGLRPFGGLTELQVAGRVGIPSGTASVILNVTVTGASAEGFVTVYPCDAARPTSSNLNYTAGQTVPNLVIARLDGAGRVCLFNGGPTHLVVDVAGYFPDATSLVTLPSPARVLETRGSLSTVDGRMNGVGTLVGGTELVLPIGGRAGVPADAVSVVLNLTAVAARGGGYLTVYPCGSARPTASNLNVVAGQTVPNAVVARLGVGGAVCVFSLPTTDVVVDVAGFFADTTVLVPLDAPARVFDSRPGELTIDGRSQGGGQRPAGGTVQLTVAGRAGVPADASAVVLNVTAVDAAAPGFVTVYPTGNGRPNSSNLNYVSGAVVPNAVTARLGAGGSICLFTSGATDLVVDVAGYVIGPPPPSAGPTCPADPPPPPTTTTPVVTSPPAGCDPSYAGVCIPPTGGDVDCAGGSGNGPRYVAGPFAVIGPDVYDLDSDHDGIGCET